MSSFRAVFEAVRDGEVDGGRRARWSRRCWGRSARTWTCSGSSTCRSWARSPSRCGWRCWRCPGERLETIERVYSISAALAQADEFLRSRPVDDPDHLQHGRRRQAGRRARGARARRRSPRRGSRRSTAWRCSPTTSSPATDNRTRFAVHRARRAEAARRCGPPPGAEAVGRAAADLARVRRAQRAGVAPPLAGGVRHARAQPVAARVPAVDRPRVTLGVPVLGRPRRRSRRPGLRRRPRRAARRDRGGPDPGHLPEGPRGLIVRAAAARGAPRTAGADPRGRPSERLRLRDPADDRRLGRQAQSGSAGGIAAPGTRSPRFAGLRRASSAQESTPAASASRSAYSSRRRRGA